MKPTLSQVCTLQSDFESDVKEYAAGNCQSMEAWFTKLEDAVERISIAGVKDLLSEHEMRVEVATFRGGLFADQSVARDTAWELFRKRLALCQELSIRTVVVAFYILPPTTQKAVDLSRELLIQAAQDAAAKRIRLAMEPQSRSAFGNNLQTMAALLAETNSPHLGVCLDLFHFFTGPSKYSDLRYLSNDNLFHVQLCDLADVPREFATDSDRIVPGDGDFEVEPIMEFLREIKYTGCVSVELMNPQIWQVPPRQFSEIGMKAIERLLP